jgi:predicted nucleic acid-binding Zn ribbon protein
MMKIKTKPTRLAEIMEGILAEKGYLHACLESDVVNSWPELVGKQIADVTECTNAENGILYVRVKSAAWRQELTFYKNELLTKIREKSRCKTINDIYFC